MLASPLTGDFRDLTLLWDRFMRSVVGAWREGERPRVIQAMRNLVLLGFRRGLEKVDSLQPSLDLMEGLSREVSEDPFAPSPSNRGLGVSVSRSGAFFPASSPSDTDHSTSPLFATCNTGQSHLAYAPPSI